MMKFKNSNCDETQKLFVIKLKKTQAMIKLKNLNCDEILKLKLWLKKNIKNSKCDKTQKLKLLQNSLTQNVTNPQNVTKLKNSNFDKTSLKL